MNTQTGNRFWKIRQMCFAGGEDKELAVKWLESMIGPEQAKANLFVLEFYRDWDSDKDIVIDDNNYLRMKFSAYKISFGKDYRYTVLFSAKFNGQEIVDRQNEYSRWQVGNGEPKWDFCQMVCDYFRSIGIEFQQGLFAQTHHQ